MSTVAHFYMYTTVIFAFIFIAEMGARIFDKWRKRERKMD